MSASARDAPALPARPVPIPAPRRHSPEDLFERVYEAVLVRGSGTDFADLRGRLTRFRANVSTIDDRERARWCELADGIEGAIDAVAAGAPKLAELSLRTGLRRFITLVPSGRDIASSA